MTHAESHHYRSPKYKGEIENPKNFQREMKQYIYKNKKTKKTHQPNKKQQQQKAITSN